MNAIDDTGPARARNAGATRAAILDAARCRFARQGYDGASTRDIAADAGIDPALINRYFGSKDDLFAEVLACSKGAEHLADGCRTQFGDRVARMLIYDAPDDDKMEMLAIMLLSAGSPKAKDALRRQHEERFHQPFECWLGEGPDAGARARLASSIILGFAVSRALDPDRLLDPAHRDALFDRLSATLQACIDG